VNVASLLAGPLARSPNDPALIEGHASAPRVTTFAQLDLAARRLAALFRRDGLKAGDHVVLFVTPSAELYAVLTAIFRIGAVVVFVEPSAGRATLDAACELLRPRAFVGIRKAHLLRVISGALRRIPRAYVTRGWVPFATSLARAERLAPDDALDETADDAPALLTFTSGSTGKPKGAIRTHAILRAQLEAITRAFGPEPGEVDLVTLPVVTLVNLANGVTTVLPNADLRRPGAIDAGPVLSQLTDLGVTRITASPAFLERLVEAPGVSDAMRSVRTVITGGGPVFPDLVERLTRAAPGARVVSVYGSTEAEPIAHVSNAEVGDGDRAAMAEGSGLLAGEVDEIARVRILPRTSGPIAPMSAAQLEAMSLGVREPGEIVVAGPHVVTGYVKGIGDQETKIRVGDEIWHRTGDAGYFDDHGRLWLLGRASAVVEDAKGVMYPFAVETAVRMGSGPMRVAALSLNGKRLLVVERGAAVEAHEVRRSVDWAGVDDVVVLEKLPMDRRHNSKVDYTQVREDLAKLNR
jgi:acyl-CoA synthetase (AMP-forming)/AMP-acid ligase II